MLLARLPGSGEWFEGGVVAYQEEIKYRLLGVEPGPVITRAAAVQMALGARKLMGADVGAATTGVAGPDSEEGQPVGTVFVGLADRSGTQSLRLSLLGSPAEIQAQSAQLALHQVEAMRRAPLVSRAVEGESHRLVIPEVGFVFRSPAALEDVSITTSHVAFTVAARPPGTMLIDVSAIDGQSTPSVRLRDPKMVSMTSGELRPDGGRSFVVAAGAPVVIAWEDVLAEYRD